MKIGHDVPRAQVSAPERITAYKEINSLWSNPEVVSDILRSNDGERAGVRVALETPIDVSSNNGNLVRQHLMAVVALGQDVALGVVKGRDLKDEVHYVSLFNNDESVNDGRAQVLGVLREGEAVTITRKGIMSALDASDKAAPDVSRTHCTLELHDGVLSVIDENSTNGTVVFTNGVRRLLRSENGDGHGLAFGFEAWSQPSMATKELIASESEAKWQTRQAKLGRFVVSN